jgi:hypothetical protein
MNHVVETCWSKEEGIVIVFEVIDQNNRNVKHMWFPYHVCGLVGHKMVECIWFVEM